MYIHDVAKISKQESLLYFNRFGTLRMAKHNVLDERIIWNFNCNYLDVSRFSVSAMCPGMCPAGIIRFK